MTVARAPDDGHVRIKTILLDQIFGFDQARLGAQLPLCACICDSEPLTLGIALGIAARLYDDHRQVASMIEGVAHTLMQERCLQPTPPQLGNRSRAAEQSNSIMNAQHASGTRFSVMFGEEAQTVRACCTYGTQIQKKIPKFGMFVRPAPCADVTPQLRFFRRDEPHTDGTLLFCSGPLDRPTKNIAYLDRSVIAGTEHLQHSNSYEGTHFVEHRRSAVEKETLNHVQRGWAQFLEYSESKSLSDGGLDAVEDCVGASAFNPIGTAVWEETTPCFRVLNARVPFGALQTFREYKVRKVHCVRLCTRLGAVAKRIAINVMNKRLARYLDQ